MLDYKFITINIHEPRRASNPIQNEDKSVKHQREREKEGKGKSLKP